MAAPSIPGYQGLTQIGTGGFSRVYAGEQSKLKRQVAIKVLNFGLNDEADRRSFERECELMGRVSTHPNIVTVHDTEFTEDGHPCIVMEHYPGGSLADLISEIGQLDAREALEVGVSIAAALEASHQAKVLHCDLKPQNILISEFGQPALGDFGISTFAEERTYTGSDAGAGFTLAYAAPEILEGASPSVTSDVYSLAATLYTSLAGRRPFYFLNDDGSRPTPAEQARRILLEQAPSLTEFGVPAEVDHVITHAMSKEPEDRPQTATDFAVALYEVGNRLGFGTSMPRIASQAALRGRMPAQNPEVEPPPTIDLTQLRTKANQVAAPALETPATEPPAAQQPAAEAPAVPVAPPAPGAPPGPDVAEPLDPSLDATEARVAPALQALPPSHGPPVHQSIPTPAVDVEPQPGRSRLSRPLAAGAFAVASIGVLVGVLFLFGGRDSDPIVEPQPTASAPVAVDPVIAPNQPTDVKLIHLDGNRALVSWSVPGGMSPEGDVTYEVRRQGFETDPLTTTDAMVVLEDVSEADATCVTLLAVRSNRTSAPTRPTCLGPEPAASISASPAQCEAEVCTIDLRVDGNDADSAVLVIDGFNQPVPGAEVDLASGSMSLPEGSAPGIYVVVLRGNDVQVGTVVVVE